MPAARWGRFCRWGRPVADRQGGRATVDEQELARACALVADVVDARTRGMRDSVAGASDDDLLATIEEAHDELVKALEVLRGY